MAKKTGQVLENPKNEGRKVLIIFIIIIKVKWNHQFGSPTTRDREYGWRSKCWVRCLVKSCWEHRDTSRLQFSILTAVIVTRSHSCFQSTTLLPFCLKHSTQLIYSSCPAQPNLFRLYNSPPPPYTHTRFGHMLSYSYSKYQFKGEKIKIFFWNAS